MPYQISHIGLMDIIKAENGDEDAIKSILSYVCDCTDREIHPERAVMIYMSNVFQSYINGVSLDKAFALIKEKGRPANDFFERNALLVVAVSYEKSKGLSNLVAFENVADRHYVSASTVKRAWEEKPEQDEGIPTRELINDKDINDYKNSFVTT